MVDDHSIPHQEGFDDNIEEEINDYPMTTLDPSRNSSVAEHEDHQNMRAATFGVPSGVPSIMPSRNSPSNQSSIPYVPPNTYESFVPFSELVAPNNGSSYLPSPFIARGSGDRNQMRTPAPTNRTPSPIEQVSPSLTLPDASLVTTNSIISTSTIRRSLTVQEQRYFLFNTFYNACLDASITYLSSLRRHHRLRNRRYHPYSPFPYQPHELQPSLMDNLSVICTHMWQKARNDGMAPHRAEAAAVRMMRNLYVWGEVVVRGFERDVDVYMDEESESESGWRGVGDSPAARIDEAVRIGEAAKSICSSLNDTLARNECDDVVRGLRDLEDSEMASEDGYGIV
jgi:hypothetical protein